MILSINTNTTTANPNVLEQGGISSSSFSADAENSCSVLVIDNVCWFDTSVNGKITSGDIVYSDSLGTNPFMGGNQYYKVLLGKSYIVLINDIGVLSISTICV